MHLIGAPPRRRTDFRTSRHQLTRSTPGLCVLFGDRDPAETHEASRDFDQFYGIRFTAPAHSRKSRWFKERPHVGARFPLARVLFARRSAPRSRRLSPRAAAVEREASSEVCLVLGAARELVRVRAPPFVWAKKPPHGGWGDGASQRGRLHVPSGFVRPASVRLRLALRGAGTGGLRGCGCDGL